MVVGPKPHPPYWVTGLWRAQAQLAAARQEAAAAKVAAGVTPERCRVSARALTEEAQRCAARAWAQLQGLGFGWERLNSCGG